MRNFYITANLLLLSLSIFSQNYDLVLLSEDTYIESREGESGLHLFVNKKGDIKSILLTESTEDPNQERSVFCIKGF